ncbi:MAG: hypothetical protein AAB815_03620 [Patescibacteria group bacterium]
MDRKKLLLRLAYLILFIFIINSLAMKFYWYFTIWYFDMPMHFLGGFWLGLLLIWFFRIDKVSPRLIFKISLGVLLIGVSWEVFEFWANNFIGQIPFSIPDTLSDIFFDLAGGLSAVFFYLKRNTLVLGKLL